MKITKTITRHANPRAIQPRFSSDEKVASAVLAVVGTFVDDNFDEVDDHRASLDLAVERRAADHWRSAPPTEASSLPWDEIGAVVQAVVGTELDDAFQDVNDHPGSLDLAESQDS